jgi:hypothetical protein
VWLLLHIASHEVASGVDGNVLGLAVSPYTRFNPGMMAEHVPEGTTGFGGGGGLGGEGPGPGPGLDTKTKCNLIES